MSPRAVHFVRHAEGYHNLHEDESIPDPDLTSKGREQCKNLASLFPYFDRIDLVCASPIRRAIQTAQTSMEPFLQSGRNKILALPLAQEATDKPANTPTRIGLLKEEFGDIVNFQRCMDSHLSDYDSKRGRWACDAHTLAARARELRLFLRDREEDEVVVVSHGDFLHYVSGDVNQEGEQQNGEWRNTEFRSYRFWPVDHADAVMQETEESLKMRNASGPGMELGSGSDGPTFLQSSLA